MKIEYKYPPNIEEIKKVFDIQPGTVFTYGDTLYTPFGGELTQDLLAHEMTHTKQQKVIGVEKWWKQYLEDDDFRLYQESEAYQVQYGKMKEIYNSKHKKFRLKEIAHHLSGKMYGHLVTYEEAILIIKENIMPNQDGTGPKGEGPKTGQGNGDCE